MATEVLVPPLGQTADTVVLVTWYKNEGETVTKGEPLFAIETDKATLDVEAPASGVLRRVTAEPGEELKVLSSIALIAEADEAIAGAPGNGAGSDKVSKQVQEPRPEPAGKQPGSEARPAGGARRIFISPRARRLAEANNVPWQTLQASGPEGAIVERDVRAYLDSTPSITPVARRMAEEAGVAWREVAGSGAAGRITRDDISGAIAAAEAAPVAAGEGEVLETIPMRSVRAVIADRMVKSRAAAAQVTLTAEADATALVTLRRQLAQDGVEVSYNDLFLYVLARALLDHPRLNASLEEDTITVWRQIHIGLAVDTDRGLLVPVIRDVGGKGLQQLARESQAAIERAVQGQSTPEELSGGTFTLTNLGMFGIDAFTPIINLPECAILGVGRITRRPVMVGDEVVGRQLVWLSLSFDHRLVDGGPAARFLQRLVQLVERPHLLMS